MISTHVCSACGRNNREIAVFCDGCGARLPEYPSDQLIYRYFYDLGSPKFTPSSGYWLSLEEMRQKGNSPENHTFVGAYYARDDKSRRIRMVHWYNVINGTIMKGDNGPRTIELE